MFVTTDAEPSIAAESVPSLACQPYWLYLLECVGGSFYAGIALDVEDRFMMHLAGKGAAYTRANPPTTILAARRYACKGDALKAEYAVKQLRKDRKLAFFAS